jgi:hypothetical protein
MWTDLFLSVEERQLLDRVVDDHFVALEDYGAPTLGTVTGNNGYFCLSEKMRIEYEIAERHVAPISPPGTKHIRGLVFTKRQWEEAKQQGDELVWMLLPKDDHHGHEDKGLRRYLKQGKRDKVDEAYKCQIRDPWYRPPIVPAPDLFFTYMSHRYPRLITNAAGVSFVNSMHGLRLNDDIPALAKQALPLLVLNATTMLAAEIGGRSYGGGILKMEPREAARLPVPKPEILMAAWDRLKTERPMLERLLEQGQWEPVANRVDEALLQDVCKCSAAEVDALHAAAQSYRHSRIGRRTAAVLAHP